MALSITLAATWQNFVCILIDSCFTLSHHWASLTGIRKNVLRLVYQLPCRQELFALCPRTKHAGLPSGKPLAVLGWWSCLFQCIWQLFLSASTVLRADISWDWAYTSITQSLESPFFFFSPKRLQLKCWFVENDLASSWVTNGCEAVACPSTREGRWLALSARLIGLQPAGWGSWSFPSMQHLWDCVWKIAACFGLPGWRRAWM